MYCCEETTVCYLRSLCVKSVCWSISKDRIKSQSIYGVERVFLFVQFSIYPSTESSSIIRFFGEGELRCDYTCMYTNTILLLNERTLYFHGPCLHRTHLSNHAQGTPLRDRPCTGFTALRRYTVPLWNPVQGLRIKNCLGFAHPTFYRDSESTLCRVLRVNPVLGRAGGVPQEMVHPVQGS